MPRRGIVNVKMVITEEKILSNIDKVQRLINPNSKKQIIELDDNSYFKDLVESIKTYLIEYPKKKNFPKSVYDKAYELVEYATNQFEENTKQVETLIKQREYNLKLATALKQTLGIVDSKVEGWQKSIADVRERFSEDIIESLNIVGKAEDKQAEEYKAAMKLVNARIANLQSNLHIEIDMERVEDRSKALSYIGIEIADALKLIPTPAVEQPKVQPIVEQVKEQKPQVRVQAQVQAQAQGVVQARPMVRPQVQAVPQQQRVYASNIQNNPMQNQVRNRVVTKIQRDQAPKNAVVIEDNRQPVNSYEDYYVETRREVKGSLWNRFLNSKFMRAVKYALKIKVVLQLPQGLPEGNSEQR